jgi:hypothetical protein
MAGLGTLEAALELLSGGPTLSTVSTDVFAVESLSSTEQRRLTSQVENSLAWHLGDNLIAHGIADKQASTGTTGELALTVYVKKKYPASVLDSSQIVPQSLQLEGLEEDVLTDVREIGELRLEALSTRVRPIPGGYSIGHLSDTGTLGCLVVERGDAGRQLVLSNSHVLAASGTARVGDPVYQPGPDERGNDMEEVARLLRWQPFDFTSNGNRIDAALAEPIDGDWFDPIIFNVGRPKGVRAPTRGMKVQKTSRTTGHTWGEVQDVHFRPFNLRYPRPDGIGEGEVSFRDQVLCSRYTQGGDSGALVLDEEGYAVGLHFCGAPAGSVFSPIEFVLGELNVDLVT